MMICRAESRHIPGIIELLRQVGEVHHRGRPDLFRAGAQKYNEAELESILADDARPIFVACEENRVLGYGFCILKETKDNSVLCDSRCLYIDDLCVDEACRGQHIGSAVYAHITQYAKSIGCQSITLNVWAFNESAMGFYRSLGMQERNIYMEMKLEDPGCWNEE